MRVVVDLERLRFLHCGLGQLSLHLGRNLLAAAPSDVQLTYLMPGAAASHFAPAKLDILEPTLWRRESLQRPLRSWLSPVARGQRFDLWHTTHQDSRYQPWDAQLPTVLTICDLNVLREKDDLSIRRRLQQLQLKVDRATAITAISRFVADEVAEHLELRDKSVEVIYCGVALESTQSTQRPAFLPEGPFVFTLGDINPKKNFHVLLDFIDRLPNVRLVIAGNKRSVYAQSIEKQIRDRQLEQRVLLPGKIPDGERSWLYQNCQALLFPSKTEGFGLPVVEAMSWGRPVFVSAATSLPEVAGPHGFYWHNYDVQHMLDVYHAGMQVVARDADFGRKLQQHAAQFTWERAAQQYLALYRRVLEQQVRRRAA
ncbi:MAG TPA: glycosyltransferase family 1 protein [Pirellulaceae bacterium]|nr:glycosyltransferase family 1 protein [Pirellulaceae bacterium]